MAIDTAAKRKSTVGVGLHFLRMGIIPDGSNLSAPQRLHTQALYSGIAAGSPAGTTVLVLERSTFRLIFGRVWGRVN
jgi:hypothetical protein